MSTAAPHLGRVFVSSVFGGMKDLRALAGEIAHRLGFEADLTEQYNANTASVQSKLEAALAACDIYLGLFDRRRGTVPPSGTVDERAITEEELRIARALGLRCLVFISRDEKDEREPELKDFLNRDVLDYEHGVWPRIYSSPEELRRDIAAGLAALRPRVILQLRPGAAGLEALLYLKDVKPAWPGEAVLGPVPVDLGLDAGTREVFDAFLAGPPKRSLLREEALAFAGSSLAAAALPGPLGEALSGVLDLAARDNRLLVLEIRTEDAAALALPWELVSLPRHPLPVGRGLLEVVRRIDSGDPSRDVSSTVPAEHLSILGFTAAPIEDQDVVVRLGTQGGFADSDLWWEKEQERLLVALDSLLREGRGRLVLPDNGDKEVLRKLLTRKDRPQVVHISCHGSVDGGKPVLLLEDSEGHRVGVGAEELLSWVRAAAPGSTPLDLFVLSACSTASSGPSPAPGLEAVSTDRAPGFAEALMRGGMSRVLGMQGPVSDQGATGFAEAFYSALAEGVDLPMALRRGRAELKAQGTPHEWAVPNLTARRDAGPLAAPKSDGAPVETPFEAVRKDFDVAGVTYLTEGYVGRRDFERLLKAAFDNPRERLLVIHGLGGIGKSTLAARFLERRRAEGARVLILDAGRELAPAALFDEIARLLGVARTDGQPPEQAEALYRKALGEALRQVVPTILYLDNFEDQQDKDGRLRNPELGEALVDLLTVGKAGFRMLLTSRLPLELEDGPYEVWNRDLGELSPSGCRKLRLLDPAGLGLLDDAAWRQALFHLGGHPKALELLGGYLRGRPERARTLLRRFEEAVESVTDRLAAEKQARGRRLLVESVLAEVPDAHRPAFDRLCLLDMAFPAEELEALLEAEGLANPAEDLDWLRDHGLLARRVSSEALSGGDAVHRLLASRQQHALEEREGAEAARGWHLRVAAHLVQPGKPLSSYGAAARHRDAAGDRAGALGLYEQWARHLRTRYAYVACEQVAREGIKYLPPGDFEVEKVEAANLWLVLYDALMPLGQTLRAKHSLEKAELLLQTAGTPKARLCQARRRRKYAGALKLEGRIEEAETELQAAHATFKEVKDLHSQAGVLGELAHIRAESGDTDSALKLYQEELGIYEQLNNRRYCALVLGNIANLQAGAGDILGALKLHDERLAIFEEHSDDRSRAMTLGDIARLRSRQGDKAGALGLLEEKLAIMERIGEVRQCAAASSEISRLRVPEDITSARDLETKNLDTARRMGDVEGVANIQYSLARLDLRESRRDQGLTRLAESWEINCQTGRADGIAFVGQLYGQVLIPTDRPRAISILQTSRDAFQKLGMSTEVRQLDDLLSRIATGPPD